jgi:hypothetical protein
MQYNKLPADPLSMVLGIIALVIVVTGCCCFGPTVIVSLVLGIIGLANANKSLKLYYANAEDYDPRSRSNVYTAKVLNIVAIVLSGLCVLSFLVMIIRYGTWNGAMLNDFDFFDYNIEFSSSQSSDSIIEYDNQQIESDTLHYDQDSLEVE